MSVWVGWRGGRGGEGREMASFAALFDEVAAVVSFVRSPSPVLITYCVHLCSWEFACFCPLLGSQLCYHYFTVKNLITLLQEIN